MRHDVDVPGLLTGSWCDRRQGGPGADDMIGHARALRHLRQFPRCAARACHL